MKLKMTINSMILCAALASFALAPTGALAQGKGKGKGNDKGKENFGKDQKHWNPAPPKKNGRHDNRNWKKWGYEKDGAWINGKWAPVGSAEYEAQRRQDTKNEWRNIALLSGGVALLGALKNDKTLMFVGAAGALYSLHRYEEDRKSQDKLAQMRASYFGRTYFVRDGVRYERKVVVKDGQKYYQFCRP
jgi:hypothetical protein